MTPYQGDTPRDARSQPSQANPNQQPPRQQPQRQQIQGAPPAPAAQGTGTPVQQNVPTQPAPTTRAQQTQPAGQPSTQAPPAQPQQYQGTAPSRQPAGSPVQPQATAVQPPQQGTQPPAGGQMGVQTAQPGTQIQPETRPQLRPIRIDEVIQEDVVTASRDTPIATVVAQMDEHAVGSVVVIENDRPVGILTDRKIALALETTPDVAQKQAGELLSGDLVTGSTSMSVADALAQLSDEAVRRLPIVHDDGTLAGIVTLDDLLVLLSSDLSMAAGIIQSQSPRL